MRLYVILRSRLIYKLVSGACLVGVTCRVFARRLHRFFLDFSCLPPPPPPPFSILLCDPPGKPISICSNDDFLDLYRNPDAPTCFSFWRFWECGVLDSDPHAPCCFLCSQGVRRGRPSVLRGRHRERGLVRRHEDQHAHHGK